MKYIYILIASTLLLGSCSKWLDLTPTQSIDASEALKTKEGITSALISVYSRLQGLTMYGRDYLALSEALSDNTVHRLGVAQLQNESLNSREAHFANWKFAYYAINQSNLIIDALNAKDYEANWKANALGQAYFLRALCYHDLVKVYAYDPTANIQAYNYGGVPLFTNGIDDLTKVGSLERASVDAVYAQIYTDLDKAHQNLSISNTAPPHKANKAAVSALFARVALFKGDYEKSVEMATRAITETPAVFSTKAKFISDWALSVHPESIFELKFNTTENLGASNSLKASYTTRLNYTGTTTATHGSLYVSDQLYNLYDVSDVRRGLIMLGAGDPPSARKNEMHKFFSKAGAANLDNVPVLRLSEVYLNRAEAYARQGAIGEAGALLDLNKIRARAGLADVSFSGAALIDEIMLQRRLELAFEGHRWFDLKRTGKDVIKSSGNVLATDYRILAPIPAREISAAEGLLKQNFNY